MPRACRLPPHQRLWADLLSSPALAFNLAGDLATDLEAADAPSTAGGRTRPAARARSASRTRRAGSTRPTSTASGLDLGDGTQGIVGVDTRYHDWAKPETPKPGNLCRYLEVAERSGAFAAGAVDAVKGNSPLADLLDAGALPTATAAASATGT